MTAKSSAAMGLALVLLTGAASAQTRDLTVDVLINSANTTGYNTSQASPGEFQRYPERYLEHLQLPYRLIDVATAPPPDLTLVPLVIAGHRGLNLSSAWQQAIQTAVQGGTGFVNLDWDTNIGSNAHMQAIFGSTGSVAGTPGTSITLPAVFLPDGATPHYIAGLQIRFPSTPAGDFVFQFHTDDNGVQGTATSTRLLNGHGTVLAKIGSDPLLTVTTFGSGRAVNFGTYDYLKADRFGFVMGLDDLFWRSLVWAARKPLVFRGFPRMFAVQQDDDSTGWGFRVGDMYNTALTGNVQADGTGGPWHPTGYVQTVNLDPGSAERQQVINDLQAGKLKIAPHTVTGGSGGDLYWPGATSSQLTDSQWQANLSGVMTYKNGNGATGSFNGTSDVLTFSGSMVPHFWDLSNNTGFDLWNNLGIRYLTEIQQPGVYSDQVPAKGPAQRLSLRPFRLYELPPTYGNPSERWPIYYADDITVGSRSGLPSQTFFSFCTQLLGFTYPSADAVWPRAVNGISFATSLENWQAYTWRFWTSMAPTQIYTHDGGNMANSTDQERQQLISTLSPWLTGRGVRHTFMEQMGAYMRARTKSALTTGQVTPSTITLNFIGSATDANGATVATKALVFYGDNDGTLVDVPGFTNGTTVSFPNVTPPGLALDKNSLTFDALPSGSNPSAQTVAISNSGTGMLNWTATENASWLTLSPASGTNTGTLTASVNIAGLAEGVYSTGITVTASGATNSPQTVSVSLVISSPKLGIAPSPIVFTGFQGQPDPTPVPMTIANLGGGTVNWTASSNTPWLTLSSTSGTAPSTLNVQASIAGLAIGTYSGSITVTAPGVSNSPQTVPVTLTVAGLLMSSNFDDGTMKGWANSPLGRTQDWSVINGDLVNNGGGHTQVFAGDGVWADYDLQVDVKLASLSDYPGGIRGRVNPATGASYALWLYPNERIVKLYRTVGWNIDSGFTLLGQASVTFDSTNFHTLKMSFRGTTIQVFVDGASLIAATDATLPSGLVALDVSNQIITFDNVFVSGSVATADTLSASSTSMTFAAQSGGPAPVAQALQVASSGGVLAWTAGVSVPWLSLSATSGVTPASINVSAVTAGLSNGTYNGTVQIVSKGAQNSTVSVPVTLVISAQPVILAASPGSFNFVGATTQNPAGRNLVITNTGNGALPWNASGDQSWLSASPASGTAPSATTVNAASAGLAVGQYSGNVVLTSGQANNSPLLVPASLRVGNLLFSDDFSSGNANNWLISPLGRGSNFSVANGAYIYNGGGPTQTYTGSQSWTDYTFTTDVKLANTSNYPGGIRARLNLTTGAGYGVWFYPGNGLVKLFAIGQWNIDSGSLSLLAQAPASFDTNTHNVRIDMQGPVIRVFYDNVQIIQVTDTTFTSGGIALDVSSQPVQYGNVKVISF
ncbi:MAG TPA: family 16 glycoside hydrolase [Candidatus Saccharimonadales bacterium]|nr:family 16 glycoside hydrolase [Candidatus Saccharimonadales bacterium]